MKRISNSSLVRRLSIVLAVAASTTAAWAHPYATALTNNAGTVSFRLSESADNVKVIGNGNTLTNDLGALPRGLTVTNLTGSGLGAGTFFVVVSKAGSGAPTLIGDAATTNNTMFFGPRAVAVNRRPASPYFGRVYVGNSPGTTASGRATGDGIYVLNADSTDALGQGNTALTAGINMDAASASMPWRIRVGADDDMLYICNWTDNAGNLFRADADVSANSGTNVFKLEAGPLTGSTSPGLPPDYNHGSIAEVFVTGSLAAGNLTVYSVDEDLESTPFLLSEMNSLWRYDIGSADFGASFPWSNAPNAKIATPSIGSVSQTMGLDRAPNGYFYLVDQRSSGNENGLQVIDPSGLVLYESRADSMNNLGFPRDILSNVVSVAVSSDMKYLAAQRSAGQVVIVPLVNGIPNLAARTEFLAIGTARQIAFDAANNVYTISAATERLRVYSLGLTTTATTGSDGTFSLTTPATSVSVTANVDTIYESGSPTTATLTVVRANDPLTSPLTVNFSTGTNAVRGVDYILQTNGVTFTGNSIFMPVGVDTVAVSMIVSNDTTSELLETATFNIIGSTFYSAGSPNSASVAIVDNDANMVDISAVVFANMFEGNTNDLIRYTLQRRGDTNAASYTVNLGFAGTATSGVDYTPPATLPVIDPGVVTVDFSVNPINDTIIESPETVVASVVSGSGYAVGTNSPLTTGATGFIIDNDEPAETVLFSDDFNADSSANWTLRFSDTNSPAVEDFTAAFAFDYSGQAVPPAPHSSGGDTLGLLLTVNKNDSTGIAAGLNAYPNGKSFSGNYAVRFDMYIMQNGSSATTEYAMFGINHSGNATNWFRNSGTGVPAGLASYDGIWAYVEADGAALGDYVLNTGPASGTLNDPTVLMTRSASTMTGAFHQPPWSSGSGPGAPGNTPSTTTPSWCEVEMSQIGKIVTVKINNTVVMTYSNTTAYTSGNLMLGYNDAYDSIGGGGGGFAIFDNLRVVSLPAGIQITNIAKVSNTAQIDFTWFANDPASAFKLYSATNVAGPYVADTNPATTYSVNVPAASYRVVTPATNSARYFRIQHQ